MHHQFKRCSYLRSSTTQLPSKVSASHRRTVVGPSIVFHFFQVQFASSFGSSFGLSFFRFSLPLGVPCVNLRLFFLLLFLLINSFTFVSAHWQTLVNVYLLSSGYTVPCPYVQTCSCLHTTMLLSPLFLRFSVLTSFWHHQRVLNCARMTMLPIYHAPDKGAFLRPPWAVCFPHLRIIAAQRGLLCSSICSFVASSSSFISTIGKCLLVIIRVYTTLPLRATCSPAFTPRCCSRFASAIQRAHVILAFKGYSTALECSSSIWRSCLLSSSTGLDCASLSFAK